MQLDLTDVALFVRVCATRKLGQAGREFGLSPAATSARIAQLEQHLGARLLHRTTRSVTLTQDGEAFLDKATQLLDAAAQAEAAVGRGAEAPQGLLRVAASVSFGRQHIVPALADFLAQYPGIRLDLRLSDTIIDMAANGIDVAVRIGPLRDSAMVARVLAKNRLLLVAAPAYLAAHGTPATPHDLLGHQCLVLDSAHPWPMRLRDGSVVKLDVGGRFRSDNGEALRDAAVAGLGIALQSSWAVYQQVRGGSLVQVLADWEVAYDSYISAVYLHRSFLPPKTRAFIDYFAARFGEHPYWEQDGAPTVPSPSSSPGAGRGRGSRN
ncbi:LysR family transcriptional regulator [Massilia sp. TS11]|uniref:LysR family transcriptional regulator n=1 Tax=Massilia sp. TS11 TaxID=2908003 RepID=UPI001ED9F43B|nr:LysR family transcriptional regulator [Massilia sp. TS11]MCG2584822.1 LysR family transcriptional regulator [Massilia sp. TS11]